MSNPFTNIQIKPFTTKDIDAFGQLQFENLERISAGRGDNSMNFDTDGLWIGNQVFTPAPFKVTLDGKLTATGVTISGALSAGAGSDIDWSYIANVVIDWAVIESAVINNLIVTNEMIADTITGKTIRTAASGRRVQMETTGDFTNHLTFFNTSGVQVMAIAENYILAGEGTIQWAPYSYSFNWSPMADVAQIFFSRNPSVNTGAADPTISGNPGLRLASLTRMTGVGGAVRMDGDWRIYGNLRVGNATDVEGILNSINSALGDINTVLNWILDNCCD